MNFQPLFTTTRVVVAVYRTVSTVVLLYCLTRRLSRKRYVPNRRRRAINVLDELPDDDA